MAVERTLSIIKPDAVAKNAVGQILSRFEAANLQVIALKMQQLTQAQAEGFYAEHSERPFLKTVI
jgi:nucleoside-diphosphate kinase